jgi:hypothetical protein
MKRPLIAVAALAVLGLGAQAALGVCGPPPARTLAVSDTARIYAVPAAPTKPVTIAGCSLEAGGAAVPLAKQFTRKIRVGKRSITQRSRVQVPILSGGFAGVAVRKFDALGRGSTTIRVVDLRSGAVAFTSRATRGSAGQARDWTVTDLVVAPDGRAAWIGFYRKDPSQSQVWIRSFAAVASIDTAAIDPVSLELSATEEGNYGIDYTKDGGTGIGNSSLG